MFMFGKDLFKYYCNKAKEFILSALVVACVVFVISVFAMAF